MADTRLLLNGFSIIGDPQTNSNARGGGELMIHNGTAVFEGDDIVVYNVTGVDEGGVLNDGSMIVGITVYDNASDYFYDIAKYEYTAPAGGGADIDFGRNTMGDRYLEFDASSLTSIDPSAPILGEMAVVAGVDILGTLASTNGPLKVPTNEDIDLNGDGVIAGGELSDGSFSSELNILAENSIVCFVSGTLIETPTGPQSIETLQVGDLVNTMDEGAKPIRWIGGASVAGGCANAPVRIKRGAIGNVRDLWVSQNHRLLVSGAHAELLFGEPQVLVAAKHLVDGDTICIVPCKTIEYWHLLFDGHQIIFAEASPVESLYPGQQSLSAVTPTERDEIVALFPELERDDNGYHLSRYTLRKFEAQALRLSA
ncbi:Hint domain-containing protein [Roseovarius sp. 217]|uniref:Hint domain-containing protein n=1 Tax=Roseovarius sp. (strain 217) TaxID=314264 RepID=UPI000068653B|nr:Hint domain-containing protein [Roseovarius sp. 217]EAQ23914.1 type I secretion target repeat protein [Roseovarius sp. 217]